MTKKIKARRSSSQIKRLRTLRANKSKEEISADARKGGLMSGGHFDSERSKKANDARWAAHRAAKAAAQERKE